MQKLLILIRIFITLTYKKCDIQEVWDRPLKYKRELLLLVKSRNKGMCLSKAMAFPIKTLHKYNFYSYYDLGQMREFFNAKSNISTNIAKVL